MIRTWLTALAAAGVFAGGAQAQETIKIGLLAPLEGAYTVLGEDGMRGFEIALSERGKTGGKTDRGHRRLDRRHPGFRGARRAQARRAGQGRSPDRPALGLRGHRDPRLRQDQPSMTFINAASGASRDHLRRPRRRTSSASTWTAPSGRRASATTSSTTRATRRSRPSARTIPSSTRRFGLRARVLRRGRRDHGALLGAARHQGFRLDHRGAARRRRCDLPRPRRRRCGQLPQPVRPGRRQRQADRRQHHGRPDRHVVEGPGQGGAGRRGRRERPGRRLGRPGWQAFVKAFQDAFPGKLPDPRCSRPTTTTRRPRPSRRSRRSAATSARARRSSARRYAPWCSTRRTARSSSTTTGRRSAPTSSPRSPRTPTAIS